MVKGNRSIFFLVRSEIQLFHQLLSEYTNNGGYNESITRFSDRQGIKASKPLNLFTSLVEFVKYVLWIGWDRMWLFSLVALLLATIYLMVILCLATFGIDMSKIFIFDSTNSNLSS